MFFTVGSTGYDSRVCVCVCRFRRPKVSQFGVEVRNSWRCRHGPQMGVSQDMGHLG